MKKYFSILFLTTVVLTCTAQDSLYHFGPDSQRKEGVPKGVVTKFEWESKLYRNFREYWYHAPGLQINK